MATLFVIPARAGSKGLEKKNTRALCGKPLVSYSIEYAIDIASSDDIICVSTDDPDVIDIAKDQYNLDIPFKRPAYLASDTASSREVMLHAIEHYESLNIIFNAVVLLQPTSPFRTRDDFDNAIFEYSKGDVDMVVSVSESKDNPYFNLFREDDNGFLKLFADSEATRRQDCPMVYKYNGMLYLINVSSLKDDNMKDFKRIKKIVTPKERSIDIDDIYDFHQAEFYLNNLI